MSKKFLFVDAAGNSTEALSYESADFINASAGVADAAKPVLTDAAGLIDNSFINAGAIDHGDLTGKGDDDHSQYILVDGTRAFTGPQSMGSQKITSLADGSNTNDAVNFGQLTAVENQIAALEFQDSVIDIVTAPPGGESTGDRYLIEATATGAFAGKENQIATYNGTGWDFTVPTTGMFTSDDSTGNLLYYTGSAWEVKPFEATTASLGCEKVGLDIRLDLLANGGLALSGNEIGVDAQDFDGEGLIANSALDLAIDWSSTYDDSKAVKASDLSSTATGKGASIIGIFDTLGNFDSDDVEGALAELAASVGEGGYETLSAGAAAGVTKGDLIKISGASQGDTLGASDGSHAVGLADSTVAQSASFKVVPNDQILEGVLSGATPGTKYYWDASTGTYTSTLPSGAGAYVWVVGVAVTSANLWVDVKYVKRNAA